MQIKGTVTEIQPSNYTDEHGNKWQWIIVNTANGPIKGMKASKSELTSNFLNQQIDWCVEEKQGKKGPYNRFTRPKQDGAEYANQSQGQSGVGGRDYDKENHGKCFSLILQALIQNDGDPNVSDADLSKIADLATACMNSYDYRTPQATATGEPNKYNPPQEQVQPAAEPLATAAPEPPTDEIPF